MPVPSESSTPAIFRAVRRKAPSPGVLLLRSNQGRGPGGLDESLPEFLKISLRVGRNRNSPKNRQSLPPLAARPEDVQESRSDRCAGGDYPWLRAGYRIPLSAASPERIHTV